jgi:starch-binding outer membrane protein, SusD/RagB family
MRIYIKNLNKHIENILLLTCLISLVSCNDWLTLLPEDSIVEEEFWENSSQVETVVMACYRYLQEDDAMQQMIWWGEMRSDNVVAGSSASTDEKNIMNANILSSNSITKWDSFYKVINICNKVIEKAPEVAKIDLNFRDDELKSYLAEAITIRSLCYFYLVRTFGDVPLILTSSSSDAIDYNVPQTNEADVIDSLISDLTVAKVYAPIEWDSEKANKGRVTKNAVRSLLADIYLWKGAINEASNKTTAYAAYQNCISLCDEIMVDKSTELEFFSGNEMFNKVFYSGYSKESIFELVFSNDSKPNNGTSTLYGNTNKGKNPHLKSNSTLSTIFNIHKKGDMPDYDFRGKDFIESGTNNIFKYEGQSPRSDFESGTYAYRSSGSQADWIFYRLSDAYLMKAEALAQMAQTEEEIHKVINLVNVTYKRACSEDSEVKDSIDYSEISSASDAQKLVLEERRREFLFEGKRWFDLVRKVRREGSTTSAWDLLEKKYDADVTLIKSKLSMVGAWYLPINQSQMTINPNLHQNDYYNTQEN